MGGFWGGWKGGIGRRGSCSCSCLLFREVDCRKIIMVVLMVLARHQRPQSRPTSDHSDDVYTQGEGGHIPYMKQGSEMSQTISAPGAPCTHKRTIVSNNISTTLRVLLPRTKKEEQRPVNRTSRLAGSWIEPAKTPKHSKMVDSNLPVAFVLTNALWLCLRPISEISSCAGV